MTRPNGNAINASVRKNVDRYEAMLMSGRREYFDEDDLLDVADYYYNDMSRKENALQCIEYALSLHPECLMALLMKAEIYFYSGKRDEAWLIIDSVSDRTDQDVLYYKGLFCLEEGKLEKSKELFIDLIDVDKYDNYIRNRLSYINQILIIRLKNLVKKNPYDDALKIQLSWCYYEN